MRSFCYLFLAVASIGVGCMGEKTPDEQLFVSELPGLQPRQETDLMTLAEAGALPSEEELQIRNDLVLKRPIQYTGFSLQKILNEQFDLSLVDTASSTLVLVCADGYAPTMPLADALRAKGLVARAMAGDTIWRDSLGQKFAPYYLVWEDTDTAVYNYPWPYALVSLQITSAAEQFRDALPPEEAGVAAGFALFRDKCMKCHSVNKVGGIMGPEFNYPKNITEYWEVEHMWQFVKNPQSYRYRSTMPAQKDLKREDFDAIIAYLKVMARNKI